MNITLNKQKQKEDSSKAFKTEKNKTKNLTTSLKSLGIFAS